MQNNTELKSAIENLWDNPQKLKEEEHKKLVQKAIKLLDSGA